MNREDLAWAAGLFEGEGCFTMYQSKGKRGPRARATLASTDRDVIERFLGIIGVGAIDARPPQMPRSKPFFQWRVQRFEHYQHVIAVLWPWLAKRRREHGLQILLHAQELGRRRGVRNYDTGRFSAAVVTTDAAASGG